MKNTETTQKKHHLKGELASRRVWLDGKELFPGPSQKLINHSPDGFNWGYGGSGPAQLAFAVCLKILGNEDQARMAYQDFKFGVIAKLPQDSFEVEFHLGAKDASYSLEILTHDMGGK
jgi:hypothetical protein